LLVSLSRSGESPESVAVVEAVLETEPETRHLIITCNAEGTLAREFPRTPRVTMVSLPEDVNDRSLVMTSSFTNLVLAALYLGWLDETDQFAAAVDRVRNAGEKLLECWPDCLAEWVSGEVGRIVFLGSGCRFAAAREGALKLLEMTAGRVATLAETYLGLRHGPMCFIDSRTLVVCFLSSDRVIRRYEDDLIRELDAKKLGERRLFAGIEDPGRGMSGARDVSISYRTSDGATDDELVLLDAMLAQIMGFHRCREEGLSPDSPSVEGIISRVVGEFRIHRPEVSAR
jgi:tagatose-6-phosphate ketose/aldose isomerase